MVTKGSNNLLDTKMINKLATMGNASKNEWIIEKSFDKTKYMSFLIKDDELWKIKQILW